MKKQSVWDRMTPRQRLIAKSQDREAGERRAAKNLKRDNPQPIVGETLPPLYKLNWMKTVAGEVLKPRFPIQIMPADDQDVEYKFWGSRRYDVHDAFGMSQWVPIKENAIATINYTICINGKGYVFEHPFKTTVHLTRAGIRAGTRIMKPYGQLAGLPKLPFDWQFYQFIG